MRKIGSVPIFWLVVMAAEPFGHKDGFLAAFALDHGVPGDLHAAVAEILEFLQSEARAHTRAARDGRGEAYAVQPVVDAHPAVAEGEGALREVRKKRQGEKPVRDGAAEGRALRALAVDVDPLEVFD